MAKNGRWLYIIATISCPVTDLAVSFVLKYNLTLLLLFKTLNSSHFISLPVKDSAKSRSGSSNVGESGTIKNTNSCFWSLTPCNTINESREKKPLCVCSPIIPSDVTADADPASPHVEGPYFYPIWHWGKRQQAICPALKMTFCWRRWFVWISTSEAAAGALTILFFLARTSAITSLQRRICAFRTLRSCKGEEGAGHKRGNL